CPTTPCCSPATCTRPSRRPPWARPASGTSCSSPGPRPSGWPCSATDGDGARVSGARSCLRPQAGEHGPAPGREPVAHLEALGQPQLLVLAHVDLEGRLLAPEG